MTTIMVRLRPALCLAFVTLGLLLAGCATQPPAGWNNVRPGMQRDQVHTLLGQPTQSDIGDAEEIYQVAIESRHLALHIQYDAGGTVAAKRVYISQ